MPDTIRWRVLGVCGLSALLLASCSGGAGGSSGPPALTRAQLQARLVTAAESGLAGHTMHTSPATSTPTLITIDESARAGSLSVLVILESTADAATARSALALNKQVYDTANVASGYRKTAFTVGQGGYEYAGTDKVTKDPSVDVYFAVGPVYAEVTVSTEPGSHSALPASAKSLAERVAPAQADKLAR